MPRTRERLDDSKASRIFSALGEPTRLRLVYRLIDRAPLSISQLGHGLPVTRQGVTKHLRVLTDAGVVRSHRRGRECLYTLEMESLQEARQVLEEISAGWDRALTRLKNLVEQDESSPT